MSEQLVAPAGGHADWPMDEAVISGAHGGLGPAVGSAEPFAPTAFPAAPVLSSTTAAPPVAYAPSTTLPPYTPPDPRDGPQQFPQATPVPSASTTLPPQPTEFPSGMKASVGGAQLRGVARRPMLRDAGQPAGPDTPSVDIHVGFSTAVRPATDGVYYFTFQRLQAPGAPAEGGNVIKIRVDDGARVHFDGSKMRVRLNDVADGETYSLHVDPGAILTDAGGKASE